MIRKLLQFLLLVLLAGCTTPDESYDWGDPIQIPDHPAYIWNAGPETNTITIVDLDKEKIVGRRQCLPKYSSTYDFAVYNKHELFFGIDYAKVDTDLGDEVRVIDPSLEMQKVAAIKTYPSPAGIYPISGDKAFLKHTFRSFQDSFWTTTLIDMRTRKVLKEFHLQNTIFGIVEFPDGRVHLFYSGWGSSNDKFTREFYSATDSLGKESKISDNNFYPTNVIIDDSLIATLTKTDGSEIYNAVGIAKVPSCETMATILLTEKDPDAMVYVNNKLYVCHNNGELMKYGNHNKVSVVDLNTKSVTKVLTVCNAPTDIAYSQATNKIVVISGVGTVISIIDPETDSVVKTIVSDEVGDVDEWGYTRLRIPE